MNFDEFLKILKTDRSIELHYDSRKVKQNSAFFCLVGEKSDGHDFIEQAIKNGAEYIIALTSPSTYHGKIILVDNTRKALAQASVTKYHELFENINLIGVTGTNGKTTSSHLMAQLFSAMNKENIGIVGTLGNKVFEAGKEVKFLGEGSGRTTPEATELHENFKILNQENNCKKIVMEVSSHALEQYRVYGCPFETAIFMNLTQDHLDYHITMDSYFQSKAKLFQYASLKNIILNADDKYFEKLKNICNEHSQIITFGIENNNANLRAINIKHSLHGIECTIEYLDTKIDLEIALYGQFNLYNCLATIAAGLAYGYSLKNIILTIQKVIKPATGRFEVIPRPNHDLPLCIIDYAHTPDGLENVLKTAREILPENGKLSCIFGCGGDRDTTKRPIMGKIAENLADHIVITSDNPRSESPEQIIADILAGISSLEKIEIEIDRAKAIAKTIKKFSGKDIVLLAGKGHETYQILEDKTIHFDDREEVLKAFE